MTTVDGRDPQGLMTAIEFPTNVTAILVASPSLCQATATASGVGRLRVRVSLHSSALRRVLASTIFTFNGHNRRLLTIKQWMHTFTLGDSVYIRLGSLP